MSRRVTVAATRASVERRQRALLSQITTQRAIIAEAEMKIAQLSCKLQNTAPDAYDRLLEQKAVAIMRRLEGEALS